ncbi:HTH CENPB-type domain-containing protein [Trichonephila clavipes]|uniref:HTH CENPB-type domain-containing protein n=1 Tax=Trichonephila clavipes TaxID=2585209 RepID=A0A8X6VH59_TRICX|nr:HTH CENPB-type domain-containing protein [Trichonephila clavipes]
MIHDEELIHAKELCEEVFFESVEVDSSSDEYEPEEKKRDIKHIPLDYKIKAVNMAKKHPTWSIKTLHSRGCGRLKKSAFTQMERRYHKRRK